MWTRKPRLVDLPPLPPYLLFFSPARVFVGQRSKPRGLWALLLALFCAVAPAVVYVQKADLHAVVEKSLKKSGKYESMPKEAREKALEMGPRAMRVVVPAASGGKRAVWILAVALAGFLWLRGAHPDLTWRRAFAASAFGSLPLVLADFFRWAVFAQADVNRLSFPTNVVMSNPAAWFALDPENTILGAFLSSVDFFGIWAVTLMGLGLAVVSGSRRNTPYILSWLVYLVGLAASVAGAFARG